MQVSAFYDQTTDVPASRIPDLPSNAFGDWIAAKQPNIFNLDQAADQVGVVAVGIPSFVTAVQKVSAAGLIGAGATAGPDLVADAAGPLLLVTQSQGADATGRFWNLLTDPATYRP